MGWRLSVPEYVRDAAANLQIARAIHEAGNVFRDGGFLLASPEPVIISRPMGAPEVLARRRSASARWQERSPPSRE